MGENIKIKKIIIISPHFPPSNLAAVHRSRFFAMHLPEFGWEPIVLTVNERYYEEELDFNLVKLLPEKLRIEKVKALPVKPLRIVGDIGIRGFIPLCLRTIKLIKKEKIDFLYIPVPSNYTSLIGRIAKYFTKIKYGIDYIDPWVHIFPGSEKLLSRHWLAMKLSHILEPVAVKKTSLITGVAEGYYEDVLKRNPDLLKNCITAAMPYGGEKKDYSLINNFDFKPYLFNKEAGKIKLVYAGAMLPKAYTVLEEILKSLVNFDNKNIEFHFIGCGKRPDDPNGFNIKPLAQKYGLWNKQIFEYPKRIPYMDVLIHIKGSDGVFILGSTESHYTPSKVYQAILSQKPIFAVLHAESTASRVIEKSGAGIVLKFKGESDLNTVGNFFNENLYEFISFIKQFDFSKVNQTEFEKYSACNSTKILAEALSKIFDKECVRD
jgi:hypothetical protein